MIDSLTNKNTLQFSMILIICRLFILLWYFQKEPTYFVCLRGCQFCPGERLVPLESTCICSSSTFTFGIVESVESPRHIL